MKRSKQKLYAAVILMYGGECALCREGDQTVLTLDHVRGNGAEARRGGKSNDCEYRRARDNYDPASYRILCWNCQHREALRLGLFTGSRSGPKARR